MNIGRMLSIAKKNLRSLKHDRRTVAFIIVVPLLIMTRLEEYNYAGATAVALVLLLLSFMMLLVINLFQAWARRSAPV